MANDPIFIVGTPRSGTTLLAAMLASHSRIACGPETHFFRYLEKYSEKEIADAKTWPKKAVKFISSMVLNHEKVYKHFGLSLWEIEEYLTSKCPSIPSILESLTDLHAHKLGKPRWVEKTPNHILYLDAIRKHYPQAKVIRIVRDPRDSALSITQKLPWASKSLIANLLLCIKWLNRSDMFFNDDQNAITIRYEQLIQNGFGTLENICKFIDEKFEPQMSTPGEIGKCLIGKGEWWKKNVTRYIDRSRVGVWKREIPNHYHRVVSCICYDLLKRYGYETTCVPKRTIVLSPLTANFIEKNEDFFVHAAKKCIKITGHLDLREAFVKQTLKADRIIVIGIPGQDGWNLGFTSRERLLNISVLATKLIRYRLNNVPVFWYPYEAQAKLAGKIDRLCYMLLSRFANRVTDSLASILQDYADA